jgi:hypothetical protein
LLGGVATSVGALAVLTLAAGPAAGAPVGDREAAIQQATPTPANRAIEDTVTLQSDADAFASSGQPDSNFGGSTILYVGERGNYGATRTLLYFDLGDLDRNQVVLDGELRMYMREAGPAGDQGRDIALYRIRDDWDEDDVTWNHFPDTSDDRLVDTSIGTTRDWYSWDVGELVRNWYDEEWDNYGIYVQGYETAGSYRGFDSREGSSEPELELEVAIDSVPPTATLNPLPTYVHTPNIQLSWPEGTDPDPSSGIDYYEVWVQQGTQPWFKAGQVDGTAYTFMNAQSGYTYGFRLVAVDRAGNRQPDGPAQATTLVDLDAPTARLNPLPEWVGGPFNLTWTGQDLPNAAGLQNSGIQHYDLEYNIDNTSWGTLQYGVPGTSFTFTPPYQTAYLFRIRALDRAGNLSAFDGNIVQTKADLAPPRAWFLAASGVDSPLFIVPWDGDDPSGSGVASFDLEFQVGTGPWQTWLTETHDRRHEFAGEYGRTYGFRIRGRDQVGHVGSFPDQAQLQVAVIRSSDLKHTLRLPYVSQYR